MKSEVGKAVAILMLVCCITAIFGCSQKKKEALDFNRYYGKSIDVFCEDFDLTIEDFEKDADYSYRSKELLPFLGYEAQYNLTFDEEDRLVWIDIGFHEEDKEKAASLYDKALNIQKFYDSIENAKYYFDSFDGEPLPGKSTYTDEDGTVVEKTIGVYSSDSDIKSYPSYSDLQNAGRKDAVGLWNLEDSVQMKMLFTQFPGTEQPVIWISFCNSESEFASPFGDTEFFSHYH